MQGWGLTFWKVKMEASGIPNLSSGRFLSLVPCSLVGKLDSAAEVSVAPNLDSLDAVPALKFPVIVKLDCLQLQVDTQAADTQPRWVQF